MRSVEIRNGRLFYYGSAVGYLEGDGLTADPMFRREDLERWLERKNLPVRWVDGVYDRLANGESIQNAQPLKSLRIWQLKPDTPIEMRFIGLDRMAREFDGPNPSQYRIAYDGQAESQELEDIWNKFCRRTLPGGDHPLAIEIMVGRLYERWRISDSTDFSRLTPEDYPILSDLYALIEQEYRNFDEGKYQLYRQGAEPARGGSRPKPREVASQYGGLHPDQYLLHRRYDLAKKLRHRYDSIPAGSKPWPEAPLLCGAQPPGHRKLCGFSEGTGTDVLPQGAVPWDAPYK